MSNEIQRADDAGTLEPVGLEVDLWTRRPVCGPRTTVIDRLGRLRADGALADFSVEVWPEEVTIRDGDERPQVLDTVERFEEWARSNGLSLRPPFETRTVSLLVGESERVLTTPMLLAAAYADGDLVGVYPCTGDERTWTVETFLDSIDPEAPDTGDVPGLADLG